jgi:hypothetical protein
VVARNSRQGTACALTDHELAPTGTSVAPNCFTRIADPAALAQIADTLSQPATIGRLTQVCDRWIYTACLCFGLDLAEQERSGFTYGYSVYTIRQAVYDLRKLRGKNLITKPGRTRRYHLTPQTAGTIAALLTLREHVMEPILAGVRSPRRGRKPTTWTPVDRDYETLRINMQTLFHDLGITTSNAAA